MRPDNILMGTDSDRHILEYDSLILELLTQTMIYYLTVILSPNSCEHGPLCLRDTQSIKSRLDSIRHIIP
jgi:hypothetical protein